LLWWSTDCESYFSAARLKFSISGASRLATRPSPSHNVTYRDIKGIHHAVILYGLAAGVATSISGRSVVRDCRVGVAGSLPAARRSVDHRDRCWPRCSFWQTAEHDWTLHLSAIIPARLLDIAGILGLRRRTTYTVYEHTTHVQMN